MRLPDGQTCDIDGDDLMGTACRVVAANASAEGGACGNVTNCQPGNVCLAGTATMRANSSENARSVT